MSEKTRLNPREQHFCEEYLDSGNATEAAFNAGYETNSASQGHRLLRKPHIKAYIDAQQSAIRQRSMITREMVLEELALIAFSDAGDYLTTNNQSVDLSQLSPVARRAIANVRLYSPDRKKEGEFQANVKLHNKLDALKVLGKHLGLFDKPEKQKQDFIKQLIIQPV